MGIQVRPPQAPERWREPLLVFSLAVAVAALLFLAFSGGKDPDPKPHPHDPRIVLVPNSSVRGLPAAGDQELILAGDWEEISPGGFVTTDWGPNAPEGFLLKVLSKKESDGRTTLKTEPGSLFEAVPGGSLVANPSDFAPEAGLSPASLIPAPVEAGGQLAPAAYREEGEAFDPFNRFRPRLVCEEPPEELKVTPSFTPGFDPYFDMRWRGRKLLRKRVETVRAGVRGELRAALTGSVAGEFKCSLKPELKLTLFKALAPVGPVPVPVRLLVKVRPTVDGQLGSTIGGTIEVGLDGFGEIEYVEGALYPHGLLVPQAGAQPPKVESGASGSVGVTPEVTIVAGWKAPVLGELAARATLSLSTRVSLSYEPLKEPLPKGCFKLTLKGTLRLNLPRPLSPTSPKTGAAKELIDKCRPLGEDETVSDAGQMR